MRKSALIVIDVQNGLFGVEQRPYDAAGLLTRIGDLVSRAREASAPVVFVRHEGGAGHPLEKPHSGWEIHPDTGYRDGDLVVEKRHCDAFQGTDLVQRLTGLGVSSFTMAGLMTEFCVDTTCRRAFSLGYDVTLASDGHSTFDTRQITAKQIIDHHNNVLGTGFAKLKPAANIEFTA